MTALPRTLILQNVSAAETAAVRQAAFLADSGQFSLRNSSIESLPVHAEELTRGALPVGSVEFVRMAMATAGIAEPANLSYPSELQRWFGREIRTLPLASIPDRCFIKPLVTKAFTGFIFDRSALPADMDAHTFEQMTAVRALPDETPVHVSDIVEFACEWRFYVSAGQVLGSARYDPDGPDDAPMPSADVVQGAIDAFTPGHPYALDVGVLTDGRTVICELNDAWSIGHYRGALSPRAYLDFLLTRWDHLLAHSK